MAIIALVSNKGGVGKTTLGVNIASALNRREETVLLDADPQGSSLQWRAIAEDARTLSNKGPVTVLSATTGLEQLVSRRLDSMGSKGGHIIIDCPPSVKSKQTLRALGLCDIALIPVQPSPLDLWASVYIEDEVSRAQEQNPKLRAFLVLNQLEPRTRLSQMTTEAIEELSVPATSTAIHRRVAYRNSVLEGRSVFDLGRRGEAASEEIERLIKEVEISV